VSAPDVEQLVIGALRAAFNLEADASDLDVIQMRLDRAIVYRNRIETTLQQNEDAEPGAPSSPSPISLPFVPALPLRKGVSHSPTRQTAMDEARRISLLTAIAGSRRWIETIINDPALDFGALAKRAKLVERHLRFLAPLATLSPRVIQAIADSRPPAGLTVTQLTRSLPLSWAEQEQQLALL
jgi:site-specific DNA recombinase